ncbi:MAG: Amidohydrolase family, partial [Actinomycetota bacterium]
VGADADFVVLDKNPLKVAPEKVNEIQVLQVYLAGVKA